MLVIQLVDVYKQCYICDTCRDTVPIYVSVLIPTPHRMSFCVGASYYFYCDHNRRLLDMYARWYCN